MAMARNDKQPDKYERVDACIRDLQDRPDYWITRSPATREAAMAGIVGELEEAGHLPFEELDMRCLTIFALSGVSIKKGTPREARLAYRVVGLLLLTLRDGSPGPLLDEAFPALSKAIQAHDTDAPPPLVAAAIECLAVASLAGARRPEEARRSMEVIWRVIVPPVRSRSAKLKVWAPETTPAVLAAAVSAWTFLLTTVVSATNTQRKAGADRRTGCGWSRAAIIASLAEMLDAGDRRVRMAAGEALAVCVELNPTQHATRKDMDALVAKVSDLAAEPASKGADNSLLREQKELFGQIAAFLDHGEPPAMSARASSMERRDEMMKVSTWVRLVQLNFLRKFLGNGFLKHVQGNPALKEAFSFGRVEGKPLSIQKKESSMPIDGFLRDVQRNRDWSWVYDNISCLSTWEDKYRCPVKLLQLGWH